MSLANLPIGVFDSGIGGLTVVRELIKTLPDESIIYFGDTARVPYGPKSPQTVIEYSREITSFLIDQGVKAVIVACNTATAHALEVLQQEFDIPIIGVVEPGAIAAARVTRTKNIGVIGTSGLVKSNAYNRALAGIDPGINVVSTACPLFVPLVEEGWLDTPATRIIAEEYLDPLKQTGIDTLVLGCTHYPLLKPVISEMIGNAITLIDSAEQTALEARKMLTEKNLLTQVSKADRNLRFIASDATEQFLRVGQLFLGRTINHVDAVALGV